MEEGADEDDDYDEEEDQDDQDDDDEDHDGDSDEEESDQQLDFVNKMKADGAGLDKEGEDILDDYGEEEEQPKPSGQQKLPDP